MSANPKKPSENDQDRGQLILIDADPATAASSSSELQKEGFKVQVCVDGPAALRYIDRQKMPWKPAIILVDAILPQMSGFEIVRRLNEKKFLNGVPIIMISKHMSPEDKAESFQAGAQAFIKKPITGKLILEQVEEIRIKKLKSEIGSMIF